MCGVCKRSTQVPSMNVVNSISKGWRDLSKGSTKIYYDLAKSAYVTCPRCSTNIAIPKTTTSTTTTTTTTESKEKKETSEDAEPGSTSAPAFRTLSCPSCGMTLNYIPPPPTMPQSETTTAPSTDIVSARRSSQPGTQSSTESSLPSSQGVQFTAGSSESSTTSTSSS